MKRFFTLGLPVLVTIAMIVYWYVDMGTDGSPQQITALEKTGDECDLISEKAAMHLPEAFPFQNLEKAARKARVLQTCMQDRAYIENPAWVEFAEPLAQKYAQAQHISFNEAYENLRRKNMLVFKAAKDEPLYWAQTKIAVKTNAP